MEPDELDATIRHAAQGTTTNVPDPPPFDTLEASVATRRTRHRRVALVGIAAVVVLALALGGLGYALIPGDDGASVHVTPAENPTAPPTTAAPTTTSPTSTAPVTPASCAVASPVEPTGAGGSFDPGTATWSELPPGPLDGRNHASYVWTGREIIVFGGEIPDGAFGGDEDGPPQRSGAAYDPTSQRWRQIADAPIAPRSGANAFWTGAEMLVWGQDEQGPSIDDGAAYDPTTNTWRVIAPAPFSARRTLAAWTGRELVAWDNHTGVGAAYDPCADRWRSTAPSPAGVLTDAYDVTAVVWTGVEMIAVGGLRGDRFALPDGVAYNPSTDTWRALPRMPGIPPFLPHAVWSGSELLIWAWQNQDDSADPALAYEPVTDTWQTLPPPSFPRRGPSGYGASPQAVWAGDHMVAWTGILGALGAAPVAVTFDPATDAWAILPKPPRSERREADAMVWTGREVVVFPRYGIADGKVPQPGLALGPG